MTEAQIKMQELETELENAVLEKNHYEQLFYDLADEYEQLVVKYRQPATTDHDDFQDGAGLDKSPQRSANQKTPNS